MTGFECLRQVSADRNNVQREPLRPLLELLAHVNLIRFRTSTFAILQVEMRARSFYPAKGEKGRGFRLREGVQKSDQEADRESKPKA